MNLTEEDRTKIKKKIKNNSFYSVIIIIICILINIGNLMDFQEDSNIINTSLDHVLIILNLVLVLSAFILFYFLNRKLYLDLQSDNKIYVEKIIQKKIFENKCDVSSGYKTNIGTPNAYLPKSINFSSNFYFVIDDTVYNVSESDFYNFEENESIKFFYSDHSKVFLGFGK